MLWICLNKFIFVIVGVKFVVLDKGDILFLKNVLEIIVLVIRVGLYLRVVFIFIKVSFIVVVVVNVLLIFVLIIV